MKQSNIRNFCIIAHIDHGKSTLADRLLEVTGTVSARDMKEQILDQLDLEREKGITIKLQPVRMKYQDFELNLIDTPGHVDFSYEVSRSLIACEGAILVVDGTQGIQAQTLANVFLAMEANLTIIPVINKIDLPASNVEDVSKEIKELLGCDDEDILKISAKTGEGVEDVLQAVINKVPSPSGDPDKPARALIFDSSYNDFKGVILQVRVVDGQLKKRGNIKLMASGANAIASDIGYLTPKEHSVETLNAGEIGYVVTDLKEISKARVGDTLTLQTNGADGALPGYKHVVPFVYAGLYPLDADEYDKLKTGLERLALNDAALVITPERSPALGHGFRIGCLGLLHLEIIKERLQRDFNTDVLVTRPATSYQLELTDGETKELTSAAELPDVSKISAIKEPWIKGEIFCRNQDVGQILELLISQRGLQKNVRFNETGGAIIDFEAPLANMLSDFYDQLKSITSGYGSFNYEISEYKSENLVRLDILIAGDVVDPLSAIVHRTEAERVGRNIAKELKELIPRQMFEVSLQAAVGGKIIARENISAMKKNVTGHLYGGDVSRKKKLWAKQKAGKKRMKQIGKVEVPPEAFTVLLKQ